jgi:hypothetical protein
MCSLSVRGRRREFRTSFGVGDTLIGGCKANWRKEKAEVDRYTRQDGEGETVHHWYVPRRAEGSILWTESAGRSAEPTLLFRCFACRASESRFRCRVALGAHFERSFGDERVKKELRERERERVVKSE